MDNFVDCNLFYFFPVMTAVIPVHQEEARQQPLLVRTKSLSGDTKSEKKKPCIKARV